MKAFNNIWSGTPIDFWGNAVIASAEESDRVLRQMPEAPRAKIVFKTYLPCDCELIPVYMCKADNNGTVYFFSDKNFMNYYLDEIEGVENKWLETVETDLP